uniref:Uncharacterized protein n=1 Tax=Anguilla anguilla TaxID=7936 RepID=A0A0E9PQY9_ANGAN
MQHLSKIFQNTFLRKISIYLLSWFHTALVLNS